LQVVVVLVQMVVEVEVLAELPLLHLMQYLVLTQLQLALAVGRKLMVVIHQLEFLVIPQQLVVVVVAPVTLITMELLVVQAVVVVVQVLQLPQVLELQRKELLVVLVTQVAETLQVVAVAVNQLLERMALILKAVMVVRAYHQGVMFFQLVAQALQVVVLVQVLTMQVLAVRLEQYKQVMVVVVHKTVMPMDALTQAVAEEALQMLRIVDGQVAVLVVQV
jgi:hypothetical protein